MFINCNRFKVKQDEFKNLKKYTLQNIFWALSQPERKLSVPKDILHGVYWSFAIRLGLTYLQIGPEKIQNL